MSIETRAFPWRVWRFGSAVVIAGFYSERLARLFCECCGESCNLTQGVAFVGQWREGEGWTL
jgi:hypothetical protein